MAPLFLDLTVIESHMEPHFAVYNLCKNIQIDNHQHIIARLPDQLKDNLANAIKLYKAWMAISQTGPDFWVRPPTRFRARRRVNRGQGGAIRPRDSVSHVGSSDSGGSGDETDDEEVEDLTEESWLSTRKRIIEWAEDTATSMLLPGGGAED